MIESSPVTQKPNYTVLALEGGGPDGAFGMGALDYISEMVEEGDFPSLDPDSKRPEEYFADSAGAANGVAELSGRSKEAIDHYANLPSLKNEIIVPRRAMRYGPSNLMDADKALEVGRHLIDAERVLDERSPKLHIGVTNALDGRPQSFQPETEEELMTLLKASTAIPGITKPVMINGELWYDGSFAGDPHKEAMAATNGLVIVILNIPMRRAEYSGIMAERVHKGLSRMGEMAFRLSRPALGQLLTYPEQRRQTVEDIKTDQENSDGRLIVIAPPDDAERISPSKMTRETMYELAASGREQAQKALEEVTVTDSQTHPVHNGSRLRSIAAY